MKTLLSSLIILCGFAALALPLPPQFVGDFSFNGKLNTLNTLKKEVVHTHNSTGQARLVELRADGYICNPVMSNTYSCAKNTDEALPADLAEKIAAETGKVVLQFGQPLGDWQLVSNGDLLTEFSVLQKTLVGDKVYIKSRFFYMSNMSKLVLETESGESLWLNIYNGRMEMPLQTGKTIDRNRFNRYLLVAGFQK